MDIVIIGGGSAGTTCAFEIRKLDKEANITLIERGPHTEYSPCALPYVLSGEIAEFDDIFIFSEKNYEENRISLLLNSEVVRIDRENKKVFYRRYDDNSSLGSDSSPDKQGEIEVGYDKLVIASGSSCIVPGINGLDAVPYQKLKDINDAEEIKKSLREGQRSAIIGAGMIGVELAYALAKCGEKPLLIEARDRILPSMLDKDMSAKIEEHLKEHGVEIYKSEKIERVDGSKIFTAGNEIQYDRLFVCAGVCPTKSVADNIGLEVGRGIVTNRKMQTSDENIYACGDCTESVEHSSGEKTLSLLGTTAVRQAKVIAANIIGHNKEFPEVLNNTISKIGDIFVGSVGINEERATALGIKTISGRYSSRVRSEYYPSDERITIKIICDSKGIAIGGQIVGDAEVAGRLNLLSLAIQKRLSVDDIAAIETCYNPASAGIFDPMSIAAEVCIKKRDILKAQNNS